MAQSAVSVVTEVQVVLVAGVIQRLRVIERGGFSSRSEDFGVVLHGVSFAGRDRRRWQFVSRSVSGNYLRQLIADRRQEPRLSAKVRPFGLPFKKKGQARCQRAFGIRRSSRSPVGGNGTGDKLRRLYSFTPRDQIGVSGQY